MPKQVLTINDFSGGLVTDVSPRDIEPNELETCTNGDPSSKGMITSCRVFSIDTGLYEKSGTQDAEFQPGYGLFTFSNDYKISDVDAVFTDEFLCSLDGTVIDITEPSTTTNADVLSDIPNQPCFYAAEGDLFVGGMHSGAFHTSYKPKSSTYHYQRQFPGTDLARTVQQWYHDQSQVKTVPTATDMWVDWEGNDLNDSIAADDLTWIVQWGGADSGGWSNDASQDSGYVQFAASWLYKNGAESDLFKVTVPDDGDGNSALKSLRVQAQIETLTSSSGGTEQGGNDLTTLRYGAKLYTKMDTEATYYLLAEVDYEKGIKGSLEDDWSAWEDDGVGGGTILGTSSAGQISATTGYIIDPPSLITFETLNGFEAADLAIDSSNPVYFKTAVIANSRAYIGNVRINNRDYGDRILKSPLYQYDVFTESFFVDIALADGDSITALTAYADRLLQFREKAVYIINISKEVEMVEDVRYGAGIKNAGAFTKCPFGVIWANKTGCFLYDGSEVKQLSMGKIRDSEWEANIDADDVLVGYDPEARQIIVIWDGANSGSGNAYIFTLDTGAWHQVSDIATQTDTFSNMVLTNDQQLVIAGGPDEGEFLVMKDRAGTSTLTMQTGQLSLGNPGSKKNLTNVKVRYKYGGSDLAVTILTNDDSDDTGITNSGNGTALTVNVDSGEDTDYLSEDDVDAVHTREYNTLGIAALQNQYWFQVKIAGTAHQSFELDEIVLTYRDLGAR